MPDRAEPHRVASPATEPDPYAADIYAADTYEADFYAWTQSQAALLRSRQFDALDLDNLIEEIESMGRQERRELVSRLRVLIAHRLKWEFQPARRSASWQATIREQRLQIDRLLAQSPSLKAYLPEAFEAAYPLGRLLAVQETNLDEATFPDRPPFDLEALRSEPIA